MKASNYLATKDLSKYRWKKTVIKKFFKPYEKLKKKKTLWVLQLYNIHNAIKKKNVSKVVGVGGRQWLQCLMEGHTTLRDKLA